MTLQQIREKLQAQENKSTGNSGNFTESAIYPHWNIEEGSSARLRFLPDADPKNPYFWVERQMIKLPFSGIKGDPTSKPNIVQVPCIEMWPDMGMCPILSEVRPWFKEKDMEELGRRYWKKKSYLFQGFVRENLMPADKTPENSIRRFIISPQIYTLVKAALMDPELENLPTDYETGLDFTVLKTTKGGYADYNTSKWARKESALTGDELATIERFSLFNLTDYLPKKPTADDLVVMKEMFEASVNGEAYDADKWGKHFRPAGFKGADEFAPAPTKQPVEAEVTKQATSTRVTSVTDDVADAPVVEPTQVAAKTAAASTGGSRAEDILALIRSKNKAAS